jgi:hypothetical protein
MFTFFVAPHSLKIISTSLKMYNISWSIPDPQTIRRYYANYSALNESSKMLNIPKEMTSVTVAVEFDKRYTFQIQIETGAGRSNTTSETWLSHSGMPCMSKLPLVRTLSLYRRKTEGSTENSQNPAENQKISTGTCMSMYNQKKNATLET